MAALAKGLEIIGIAVFLAGLVWFAHFAFSLRAYGLSVATMAAGLAIAFVGSPRFRDILFRIRRYFLRTPPL